ncbi:MAG: hypothetical protein DYG99_00625 [Bacteroidetes bacterium CHB5]|nr:hypothetical protein [Bacteroidetes bacterium CHB5]
MRFFLKLLFVSLFLGAHGGWAQSNKTDTTLLSEAKNQALTIYNHQMRAQSNLINGIRYAGPQPITGYQYANEDHPYYLGEWKQGTVLYHGEWYEASLLYNIATQKLVIDHGPDQVQLINEHLGQFSLDGHHFVKESGNNIPEGFYEITYNGPTRVYVRWLKNEETVYKNGRLSAAFLPKTTYYIRKNDIFYPVKSKRSVLKVLQNRSAEIKNFIRSQNHYFSDNRIFFITECARIYDTPNPKEKPNQ